MTLYYICTKTIVYSRIALIHASTEIIFEGIYIITSKQLCATNLECHVKKFYLTNVDENLCHNNIYALLH